jgi:ribosomal protein S18 acetylase RimI-like enzyme
MMKLAGYRQDMDIVAVTEEGEFAACFTCWIDSANNVAEFEPVGCLPKFRRRGIMRALTNEGLRRLKALRGTSAVVRTNPFNLLAIRLYESCGFELVFHDPVYRKTFVG